MSRRIALPGADELFRSTGDGSRQGAETPAPDAATRTATATLAPVAPSVQAGAERPAASLTPAPVDDAAFEALQEAAAAVRSAARRRPRAVADRQPTGRERHDEKITVYVSAEELMDLEQARLTLRGDHGLSVDRGRIVREALAVVLADLDAKGEASILVRRLRGR
jgi:hypothetical protein